MLFGVGLILLPSVTIREKVLIIAASLAVSVAGLTGVGAWRSRRRFGLTALAGGLAIVCLAGLSVVAASAVRSTAHAATGSSPAAQSGDIRKTGLSKKVTSGSPTPTPTPTLTHVRTHGPSSGGNSDVTGGGDGPTASSPAVDPIYLSTLTGDPGSEQRWVGPLHGSWSIGGVKYSRSLGYSGLCDHNTPVIYDVDKSDRIFLAEVGVADGGSAADRGTQVMYIIGAGTGGGRFSTLTSATAEAGDPSPLDVPLPPGTTELELTTNIMDEACLGGSVVVWGNARVAP